MNKFLPPSAAASVAARVYDIRSSDKFSKAFSESFDDNFRVTNNQIKGFSGGLINSLTVEQGLH